MSVRAVAQAAERMKWMAEQHKQVVAIKDRVIEDHEHEIVKLEAERDSLHAEIERLRSTLEFVVRVGSKRAANAAREALNPASTQPEDPTP